jgi:hypothetical protein
MGSTSNEAFVTLTFQHWQEQATDPMSERNPPAGINLQSRPRCLLRCLLSLSSSRRHDGKAFVTPTLQRQQQATDPISDRHPPAVDLRGGPRRRLCSLIVVVVVFVKARWSWPVNDRLTRTMTASVHCQPTRTLPPPPLPLLEQSN